MEQGHNSKILIIVIVVVIAAGVAWFLFGYPQTEEAPLGSEQATNTMHLAPKVSESDDVSAIDADLQATDVLNLTPELDSIDKALATSTP